MNFSELLQKIKSFLHLSQKGRDVYESQGINPRKDWVVSSIILFCVLCVGFIFAYYFYSEVSQGKLFSTTSEDHTESVVINSALLKKIIGGIDGRATNFGNIQNNKVSIPDPSL